MQNYQAGEMALLDVPAPMRRPAVERRAGPYTPPLPVRRLPAERSLGWHLWGHPRARSALGQPDPPSLVGLAGRRE